jgi:hypothetical protein
MFEPACLDLGYLDPTLYNSVLIKSSRKSSSEHATQHAAGLEGSEIDEFPEYKVGKDSF